ncbi:helix-turn-helix DNA binding domain protein [Mycobacterium phage Aminay]|uniref:Helix-turn-helix DNA binding domain protein n=1 Tax=Mycobacterium phage Aminay TaxID=2250291 RepID=A0A345KV84_9CAUD|nr:helix-turn-helix DNA binding domain protein [Mycobacterium phage Aminay]AXH46936.1 helix-turn-helix DNA binding domain protein [Mycobacterium phage Aminay]
MRVDTSTHSCRLDYMTTTKIAATTAEALLAIFAGQTVTLDELFAQIEQTYILAGKRTGITSFYKITDLIEAAGVTSRYTGPDYTGVCLYTFPHKAL